jgi:hypothetical protein
MKNPYFVGPPPGIYDFETKKIEDLLITVGRNTGNLLFISTLNKIVSHIGRSNDRQYQLTGVENVHDGIIVPAANWFNNHSDLGGLATRIEATDLPCVMIGLGAQSLSFDQYPSPKAGTLRLMKVVSERCHSISVRGEYTAASLANYGIKNVEITGCPSLLWNMAPLCIDKPDRLISAIAVGSTRSDFAEHIFRDDPSFRVKTLVSRFARQHNFDYVAQTEMFDMQIAAGEVKREGGDPARWDYLLKIYNQDDRKSLQQYMKFHMKAFFNVESWISYLKQKDFLISTRLHGVLAALLAGTPAVLIEHDTRTSEMAKYVNIPFISASEAAQALDSGTFDIQEIYDQTSFDQFNRYQHKYYETFVDYFKRNDVAVNLMGL